MKNIDIATPSIQLLTKVVNTKKIKNAKEIYKNLIFIPSYHSLNKNEIISIAKIIQNLCQK